MKRVLITGANSYVGSNLERWLMKEPDKFQVDTIDMIDGSWREKDFSGYDVVFHVAGIVHVNAKRNMEALYYKINTDLALETAQHAKNCNIKQFIFMSSIAVYGLIGNLREIQIINSSTPIQPTTFYGKSKAKAEIALNGIRTQSFKIVIMRSPVIYGEGCPGNYAKLEKFVSKSPVFPLVQNQRSAIHIHRLTQSIQDCIELEEDGVILPQDEEFSNTSLIALEMAKKYNKKLHLSRMLGWCISRFGVYIKLLNKIFGSLIIEKEENLLNG